MPAIAEAMVKVVDGIADTITFLDKIGGAVDGARDHMAAFWDDLAAHRDEDPIGGMIADAVKGGPDTWDWPFGNKNAPDWARFSNDIDGATAKMQDLANFPGKMADDITSGTGAVRTAAKGVGSAISDPITAAHDKAVQIAGATPEDIAQAIVDQQFNVKNAMDGINKIAEDALTRTAEIAQIKSFLASSKLAKALNDSRPAVRIAAQGQKDVALGRLAALEQEATESAQRSSSNYANHLDDSKGAASTNAGKLTQPVRDKMIDLKNDAGTYGARTGNAYANNLAAALAAGVSPATAAMRAYHSLLATFSPPGPKAALYGIDRWGRNTGKAYVDPFIEELAAAPARARGALSSVAGAIAGGPRLAALIAAPGGATAGTGGLSGRRDQLDINLTVRDPDGGLARAGISANELSRLLGSELRTSLVRTSTSFARPATGA